MNHPAIPATTHPTVVPEGTYGLSWGHPAGWPAVPDGRAGALRGRGAAGLRAQTDLEAIEAWFAKKAGKSRNTLLAYRKEITRLLLWAASRHQALSDLRVEDFVAYREFLRDPQPTAQWVGSGRRYGLQDPRWRPFAGGLSESSRNQAMTILHDLTQFLSDANYLALNPLSLLDRRMPDLSGHAGRRNRLSTVQWGAIKTTIAALPSSAGNGVLVAARARWVFTVLYLLGPRISDLLGRFEDIQPETIQGRSVWVWNLVGKGNKQAYLPFSDELTEEMRRFRKALDQPSLPLRADVLPIVPRLTGNRLRPMHRSSLHHLIKSIIRQAADHLDKNGESAESETLRRASAHWLRHTAASETLDMGADLVLTAELMRHSDVRTTQGYTHKDLSQLLGALQSRHAGWDEKPAHPEPRT